MIKSLLQKKHEKSSVFRELSKEENKLVNGAGCGTTIIVIRGQGHQTYDCQALY